MPRTLERNGFPKRCHCAAQPPNSHMRLPGIRYSRANQFLSVDDFSYIILRKLNIRIVHSFFFSIEVSIYSCSLSIPT
jgi:hypothetical protein